MTETLAYPWYDVVTAFKLLDIIQGHPGYTTYCYQCGGALTDILGVFLPDVVWVWNPDDPGPMHDGRPAWTGCPIYGAQQMAMLRERMTEARIETL